jgi:hypothetical protein
MGGFAQEDIPEGSKPNPGNREMPLGIENINHHAPVLTCGGPLLSLPIKTGKFLVIEMEARSQAANRWPLPRLIVQHELVYRARSMLHGPRRTAFVSWSAALLQRLRHWHFQYGGRRKGKLQGISRNPSPPVVKGLCR